MSKKQAMGIIILAVIISWLFNFFAGRFLMAKISTWPLLNRWHLLSPQAPIVITNRETVRISDTGDVLQASSNIKSKISTLVLVSQTGAAVAGSALNLSSDGSFVTPSASFAKPSDSYFVLLSDGRNAKITEQVTDSATSLTFFKASLNNVPVANFASSKNIGAGEKILFVANSLENFVNKLSLALVSSSQNDIAGQVLESDFPKRSFVAQSSAPLLSGEALANTNSEILGLWSGSVIVSSDVLKQAAALYFADNKKIHRPSFGFSYSIITQNESKLTGIGEGAWVKDVSQASAAAKAGLLTGDIITKVGEQGVSENSPLEETLQKYKPGDQVSLAVVRKNQPLNLTLIAGELK